MLNPGFRLNHINAGKFIQDAIDRAERRVTASAAPPKPRAWKDLKKAVGIKDRSTKRRSKKRSVKRKR